MKQIRLFIIGLLCIISNNASASDNSSIVIGHQVEKTGDFSSWGYWINKAAQAAVEEINSQGGINGVKLKYISEDTESKPQVGVRKYRKLVHNDKADVILGSVHSGVMMASLPIVQELKIPYFPIAMSCEGTGPTSNRYVFRLSTQVCLQAKASIPWVLDNISSKWTTIVSDYAWGHSHENEFTKSVKEFGGSVLGSIRVPLETTDFLPYVKKIPKDTDAIYFVFFDHYTTSFLQALKDAGIDKKLYTVICSLEAIDTTQYKDVLDGTYVLEYLPRRFDGFKTSAVEKFRKLMNVNGEGFALDDPKRVIAGSHYWAAYEHVQLIAQAMKRINYKHNDNPNTLIEELERVRRLKESNEFPQGDAILRTVDHQGFHDHWMSQVYGGKLISQFRLPLESVIYDARSDIRH